MGPGDCKDGSYKSLCVFHVLGTMQWFIFFPGFKRSIRFQKTAQLFQKIVQKQQLFSATLTTHALPSHDDLHCCLTKAQHTILASALPPSQSFTQFRKDFALSLALTLSLLLSGTTFLARPQLRSARCRPAERRERGISPLFPVQLSSSYTPEQEKESPKTAPNLIPRSFRFPTLSLALRLSRRISNDFPCCTSPETRNGPQRYAAQSSWAVECS